MKKKISPVWRGFTVQLFAITVLPLTLLLLVIAFGSVTTHQRDMRSLVGERDERAVQAATATLESELHHRLASISSLAAFANSSRDLSFEKVLATSADLTSDFDGGVAFLDSDGAIIGNATQESIWNSILRNRKEITLASSSNSGPIISIPFTDQAS